MAYAMSGKQLAESKAKDPAIAIKARPAKGAKKKAKKGPAQNQELTQ